jgi:hypothetical protein
MVAETLGISSESTFHESSFLGTTFFLGKKMDGQIDRHKFAIISVLQFVV